eukprot:395015_1
MYWDMVSFLLIFIGYVSYLCQTAGANICNTDLTNSNCDEQTNEYKCIPLLNDESSDESICGCVSKSIKTSVIIIIDASNHTKEEWRYVTLKWLKLYYDEIYELHPLNMINYILAHGDFILTSLNKDPLSSYLGTDAFIDTLSELSKPNACVAFKRVNTWLMNNKNNININNTAIIYYAKTTPFAPGFPYHCQEENKQQYKLIHPNKHIFAIKYYDNINLNYVQRDIGEFAYEMSIFPNIYSNDVLNNKTDQIVSWVVSNISNFVCTRSIGSIESIDSGELIEIHNNQVNKNITKKESDCCVHASGIEYNDIKTCDLYKIQEIEYLLSTQNCLYYCNPFHFYLETNHRNWDCIINYALWVQLYYICDDLDSIENINITMWNDYRWHCPMCYNISTNEYKSICRSNDGKQELLNTYINEHCDCKDVTLFLVIIIEITALLSILIGMFILWYRFNVIKVKQHLREKGFLQPVTAPNLTEEIVLNDIDSES